MLAAHGRGGIHRVYFHFVLRATDSQAIAELRTHLVGLGGLRRGGLSRLGLGFHIAGC